MFGPKFHNCSFVMGRLYWPGQSGQSSSPRRIYGYLGSQGLQPTQAAKGHHYGTHSLARENNGPTMDLSKHYSFEKSDLLTRQVSHHEGVSILTFFEKKER